MPKGVETQDGKDVASQKKSHKSLPQLFQDFPPAVFLAMVHIEISDVLTEEGSCAIARIFKSGQLTDNIKDRSNISRPSFS